MMQIRRGAFSHADIPLEEGKRTVHKLSSEELARLGA